MIRCAKPVLMLLLLSFSALANAGNSSGVVTKIYAHADDIVMFGAGVHNNRPACSGDEWAFSVATPTGRAMLALLLSAHAQGKPVNVDGMGRMRCMGRSRSAPIYHR